MSGSYPLGPNGYALGPLATNLQNEVDDRETVVNLHFGIPHHMDGGKDDIQLLYDNSWLHTTNLTAYNDWGQAAPCLTSGTVTANCLATGENNLAGGSLLVPGQTTVWGGIANPGSPALNPLFGTSSYNYLDRMIYNGPVGQALTASGLSAVTPYYFPQSPQNRPFAAVIPAAQRDSQDNHFSVEKLQYQKNMGSNAYLRVYGYSFYSDWFYNGADSIAEPFNFGPYPSDYELIAHDRGVGLQFADQLNCAEPAQRFRRLQLRYDEPLEQRFAVRFDDGRGAVSSANPTAGCYTANTTTGVVAAAYCGSASRYVLPGYESNATTLSPNSATAPTLANAANYTCGGAPFSTSPSTAGSRARTTTSRRGSPTSRSRISSRAVSCRSTAPSTTTTSVTIWATATSRRARSAVRFRRKRVSSGPTATTSGSAATLRRRSSYRLRARTGAPR